MKSNLLIEEYIKKAEEAEKENKQLKALNLYLKANELSNGEEIEVLISLALIYHNLGKLEKAKAYYKEAISINEDEERAYYGLAVIYDENSEYEKAINLYKKAIYINPNYNKAYFFLANAYDILGDKESAIKYYEKLLELNEEDFWANINLGSIYEELDINNLAYKKFSKALDIDKEDYLALFNMGVISAKFGMREKAIDYYKKSIKKNLGYAYSFLNLAVLYKHENLEKGIEVLTKGISFNPSSHFLYYNRACFYAIIHDFANSIKDLELALKLYPDFIKYILEDEELALVIKQSGFKRLIKNS